MLTEGWTDNPNRGVISATSYWTEELPYNQAGNYHLDGWNTGIAEGGTWEVKSSTFTLGGSGYISVRMGSNAAAVRVYQEEDTLIGYYKQTRFNDIGTNIGRLAAGGSLADMGTYVIDLRGHLGERLSIKLCDETPESGGWAHAFFDEIVTYYATAPDYVNLFDTVNDSHANGVAPMQMQIPWRLATNLAEQTEPNSSPQSVGFAASPVKLLLFSETPENTNGEDAEEPSADVDNTVTGPAPDDPIAEPTPNDPDPAMPVDEEDDPALKDDDDPDGEGSPIQEEKPESEEEPNAESQNGEP